MAWAVWREVPGAEPEEAPSLARRLRRKGEAEVLFVTDTRISYVVFAVGPSVPAAVAAAEEEAARCLGCESATDWRAA